jgi:hypothetical protein
MHRPKIDLTLLARAKEVSASEAHKRRQWQAYICAWLNTARYRIGQQYSEGDLSCAPPQFLMTQMEDPASIGIVPDPEGPPTSQPVIHEVGFTREEHACFIHREHRYYFWRSLLACDENTPPVCSLCLRQVTQNVLEAYLSLKGWVYDRSRYQWKSPNEMLLNLSDVVAVGRDPAALHVIARDQETLVEAIILDLMPPLPPGMKVTLFVTDEEIKQLVAAEQIENKGSQRRSGGMRAFTVLRELGASLEDLSKILWRSFGIAIVPPPVIAAMNSRVLVGELCRMSVQKLSRAHEHQTMSCGTCGQRVNVLELGIVEPHLVGRTN